MSAPRRNSSSVSSAASSKVLPHRWLELLHPFDRDRYSACLDTILEQRCGRIALDFRLRAADGHYMWFLLKARPVVGAEGDVIRVVGTLSDVTESKTAEERLLHDAVHDNLTGLPNRELFFDRLGGALHLGRNDQYIRPTVICIDLDRFRQINDAVGMTAGDSILLTVARRLSRLLKEQDTLARIASDQFAIILLSENDTDAIIPLADTIRRALNTPVTFGDREIGLTASIGIALFDPQLHPKRDDMLKDAEIAMAHGKRLGGNRIEVFRPGMRAQRSDTHGARGGSPPRASTAARCKHPLPAGRAARGSHRRRLRSAVAVGSSASRPPVDRRTSSPSPNKRGSSSISAFSRSSGPRANSPPGSARSTSIRRSSRASTSRRGISCGTTCCRT